MRAIIAVIFLGLVVCVTEQGRIGGGGGNYINEGHFRDNGYRRGNLNVFRGRYPYLGRYAGTCLHNKIVMFAINDVAIMGLRSMWCVEYLVLFRDV